MAIKHIDKCNIYVVKKIMDIAEALKAMRQIVGIRKIKEWCIEHGIDHGQVYFILSFLIVKNKETKLLSHIRAENVAKKCNMPHLNIR